MYRLVIKESLDKKFRKLQKKDKEMLRLIDRKGHFQCEALSLITQNVNSKQPVEKVFFLSLRAKRGNLAFNKIDGLEIASSQKLLLAMTCEGFFNSL